MSEETGRSGETRQLPSVREIVKDAILARLNEPIDAGMGNAEAIWETYLPEGVAITLAEAVDKALGLRRVWECDGHDLMVSQSIPEKGLRAVVTQQGFTPVGQGAIVGEPWAVYRLGGTDG